MLHRESEPEERISRLEQKLKRDVAGDCGRSTPSSLGQAIIRAIAEQATPPASPGT
jgi:hypothetical protein